MPTTGTRISDQTANTPTDASYLPYIDPAGATPAGKGRRVLFSNLATYVLGKREAVMTQAEAEAGTVTDRRGITPAILKVIIASLATGIKHKADATRAPLGTDDSASGYSALSLWLWPAQSRIWIAKSVGVNIASWLELTGGGGGLNEEAVQTLIDTALEGYATSDELTAAVAALTAAIGAIEVGEGAPAATQEEAEAGEGTELRSWSPLRIAQAIAALAGGASLPATATEEEATAGSETDPRTFSPSLIGRAIGALAPVTYERLLFDGVTITPGEHAMFRAARSARILYAEFEIETPGTVDVMVQLRVDSIAQGDPISFSGLTHSVALAFDVTAGANVTLNVIDDGSGVSTGSIAGSGGQGLRALLLYGPQPAGT